MSNKESEGYLPAVEYLRTLLAMVKQMHNDAATDNAYRAIHIGILKDVEIHIQTLRKYLEQQMEGA